MNSRLLSVFSVAAVALFLFGISLTGCSSSTSTEPTAKQGVLGVPVTTVELGMVAVGQSHSYIVMLRNTGTDTLTVTNLVVLNSSVFSTSIVPVLPLKMLPSDSLPVTITFAPRTTGDVTTQINVSAKNAKDTLVSFNVHAQGVAYRVKVNNTYTYAETDYSFNGALLGHSTVLQAIVSVDKPWADSASTVRAMQDTSSDYYIFEPNGDVMVFFQSNAAFGYAAARWERLPIASKDTALRIIATGTGTANYNGIPVPFTDTTTVRYVGSGTLSVQGESIETQHCQLTITFTAALGSGQYVLDYYFSPRLGFFAHIERNLIVPPALQSLFTGVVPHTDRHITAFTLN